MFVCHGNICRSTMAEFLFARIVKDNHLSDKFIIASSGTSSEEEGNPVHYGTRKILNSLNISCDKKRAVKLKKSDYDKYDFFIGMDKNNVRNMHYIFGGDPLCKISTLMEYTERGGGVADPYWTGDFNSTYIDVKEGVEGLFAYLKSKNFKI